MKIKRLVTAIMIIIIVSSVCFVIRYREDNGNFIDIEGIAERDTLLQGRIMQIKENFVTEQDDIEVNIDTVIFPTDKTYPIIKLKKREVTSDEVKQWSNILFEGNPVYEDISFKYSKSDILEMIEVNENHINHPEQFMEEYSIPEEEIDSTIENLKKSNIMLEKFYEEAPEVVEETIPKWVFHSEEYYDSYDEYAKTRGTKCIRIKGEVNGYEAILQADNNKDEGDEIVSEIEFFYPDYFSDEVEYDTITEEGAKSIANNIVDKIEGLDKWELVGIKTVTDYGGLRGQTIELEYSRIYENDTSKLLRWSIDFLGDVESLVVLFNRGNLAQVRLHKPSEFVEVIDKKAQIINIPTAIDMLKEYMITSISYETYFYEWDNVRDFSVDINEMEIGLLPNEMKNDTYLRVPVYIFRQTLHKTLENGEKEDEVPFAKEYIIMNALDGSIIGFE